MVLALQAGVVSQELLDALTAVDNKLSSACLFAEYWDTHSERDAWFQQHLSSQLHSLAVPLLQWCCDHSASCARGSVHIPVYSSPPSCQPAAPSSDRNRLLLYLPMDHYLRQHGSKKNINMFWRLRSIMLHRWASYLDSFKNSVHPRCVRPSNLLAFATSSLQPRHQPVPFVHTTCRSRDS